MPTTVNSGGPFSCANRIESLVFMAPSRGPQPLARTLHATLENHKGSVNVARYSKGTANYILTGGQDRTVRLWNPNTGLEIKTFAAHGYEVLSITVYASFISVNAGMLVTNFVCEDHRTTHNLRLLEGTAPSFCGMSLAVSLHAVLPDTWERYMQWNLIKMLL